MLIMHAAGYRQTLAEILQIQALCAKTTTRDEEWLLCVAAGPLLEQHHTTSSAVRGGASSYIQARFLQFQFQFAKGTKDIQSDEALHLEAERHVVLRRG